jgi:hypothetical protein
MMKKLYFSYNRFSTPDQIKGDSLRRQQEGAKAYVEKKGGGVAPQTIYRFIRRGLLKSSFASRKIIISKNEIERFLKETSRSQYEK